MSTEYDSGSILAWWEAQLDGTYKVFEVTLYRRTDPTGCCPERTEVTMSVGGQACPVTATNSLKIVHNCYGAIGNKILTERYGMINFCGIEA